MKNQFLLLVFCLFLFSLYITNIYSEEEAIILKNIFNNLEESVVGTDIETNLKLTNMSSQPFIMVDLMEKVSYSIEQPLTSTMKDVTPYYGFWLYGGENKIPILLCAIQVDKSEVPPERQIKPENISYGQSVFICYFKIAFDLNRDYDFTNDKAFYQYFQMPYYNAGPSNQVEVPLKYTDGNMESDLIKYNYRFDIFLKRETTRDASSQLQSNFQIKPIPQAVTVYGLQSFETQINFGNETNKVWIVDENLNGVFDSGDIFAVDLNKDNEWDINSRFSVEKFKLNDTVNVSGKSYLVKEVNPIKSTIKITESKKEVKPRELFGIGSKAPVFARLDFISRKMLTTIDLKGKPYIFYYSSYFNQTQAKEIQNMVSILDKYIGMKKMSLIMVFDDSNFDKIIESLTMINKPYYLVRGSSERAGGRARDGEHILNGFKIDELTVHNKLVMIAVDRKGIVKYLNKNANLDNVVELCEILKPNSTKIIPSIRIFKLFGKKIVEEQPVKLKSTVEIALEWFNQNDKIVNQIFEQGRIIYLKGFCCEFGVYMKTIGENDVVRIPDLSSISYVRLPRFSVDRKVLYMLIYDLESQKTHIVAISKSGKHKDLIELDGSIISYDVSPDGLEIIYSKREETLAHLYRQKFGSNETIQISENNVGGNFPAYSPDGKWVSYCAQRKLRLYNIKTGERKILVDDELMKEFPEWSLDGKWIVYQASAEDEYLYDIYKVEVATGNVVRLTKELGTDANPYFSKDGSKIIFISERDTGTNNQTVYMLNADGTDVKRDVTADTGVFFPRW